MYITTSNVSKKMMLTSKDRFDSWTAPPSAKMVDDHSKTSRKIKTPPLLFDDR